MWEDELFLDDAKISRHLAIAGTGRAGTSFLVRYLTELGLDTTLARGGKQATWDKRANAGLEENLAASNPEDLPYVVKSPWLFESIDFILSRSGLILDAVIVPVRDLSEAAASRAVLERQAMHKAAPWMLESSRSWETWGTTAGGLIYSMNPIDEGRLLAVGFHHLIERLTAAEVPVVLLTFPRLAQDAEYLYRKLRPFLPAEVTEAAAVEAHRKLADPEKIRIGDEIRTPVPQSSPAGAVCAYPSPEEIDRIALGRALAQAEAAAEELRSRLTLLRRNPAWRLTWPLRVAMAVISEAFGRVRSRRKHQARLNRWQRAQERPGRAGATKGSPPQPIWH